jgi:hypothetical protein
MSRRTSLAAVLAPLASSAGGLGLLALVYFAVCGDSDKIDKEYRAKNLASCQAGCDDLARVVEDDEGQRRQFRSWGCPYPCTDAALDELMRHWVTSAEEDRLRCRKDCEEHCNDPNHSCP